MSISESGTMGYTAPKQDIPNISKLIVQRGKEHGIVRDEFDSQHHEIASNFSAKIVDIIMDTLSATIPDKKYRYFYEDNPFQMKISMFAPNRVDEIFTKLIDEGNYLKLGYGKVMEKHGEYCRPSADNKEVPQYDLNFDDFNAQLGKICKLTTQYLGPRLWAIQNHEHNRGYLRYEVTKSRFKLLPNPPPKRKNSKKGLEPNTISIRLWLLPPFQQEDPDKELKSKKKKTNFFRWD